MNSELISALILGSIGGAIPGPVVTSIFTEILQSGLIKSFRIIFWAMLTETIIALFCLLLLSSINFSFSYFNILSIIGALILLWISTSIWKINKIDSEEKIHFSRSKISSMIIANGILWTFWITVCIPKAMNLNEQMLYGKYFFILFFEIGWLIATIALAIIFSQFRKLLTHPKIVPIVFKIFALVFVYFALDMLYKSLIYFI